MKSRLTKCSPNIKDNQENFRYLNKDETENERQLYHSYWDELINLYGTKGEYYVYQYDADKDNSIYGEHTTAQFSQPININILANIPSESLMLSKFGYDMNSDFVGIVAIADWREKFGTSLNQEPKSGDVIRLVETGWPRNGTPNSTADLLSAICENKTPAENGTFTTTTSAYEWIRCPWIFEITERDHQDFSGTNNMLLGHYTWILKGKRFDYSYQPGIDPECHMDDVNDETFSGILSGGSQPPSPPKTYEGDANEISKDIWEYDQDTGVYGGY